MRVTLVHCFALPPTAVADSLDNREALWVNHSYVRVERTVIVTVAARVRDLTATSNKVCGLHVLCWCSE